MIMTVRKKEFSKIFNYLSIWYVVAVFLDDNVVNVHVLFLHIALRLMMRAKYVGVAINTCAHLSIYLHKFGLETGWT